MARNSLHWVVFDQAAPGLDLVVVPLYTVDRPENIAMCCGTPASLKTKGTDVLPFPGITGVIRGPPAFRHPR